MVGLRWQWVAYGGAVLLEYAIAEWWSPYNGGAQKVGFSIGK